MKRRAMPQGWQGDLVLAKGRVKLHPWRQPRVIRAAMSYDRADFDYSTEDQPLPPGHAATHIGMFLAWAVMNGLESDFHHEHSAELLARLRRREITGRQFFQSACGERFSERDLNDEANAFVEAYYVDAAGKRGEYFADYKRVLAEGLPSFWHVADTWDNYEKIAAVIGQRYQDWKNPRRKKRWWQFWKFDNPGCF